MIDTDNSGQITFEELKAGLKKFGANLKESEIYDLMQAVSILSRFSYDVRERFFGRDVSNLCYGIAGRYR